MKRHTTTIVLVLAAAAFAVWFFLFRNDISEGERERRVGSVFPAWRREDLTRIEIARKDDTLVLERDAKKDGAWRMTKPREDKADQAAIEKLLTTLEFATIVRKATEQMTEPRARVTIAMKDIALHFSLGGESPRPQGSAYAKMEEGETIVVSKEVADSINAPSDTYRDKSIVPYLSTDLSRFETKHPGGGFALERIDDRSFRVASEGVLLSRGAADKVWGALAEVRAESFPADGDIDRLTANPKVSFVMTPKDGRPPAELVIGDACPGQPDSVAVLRKTPTRSVACAPKMIVDAFTMAPSELVEKAVFTLKHDEVEELRLEMLDAPNEAIEIARRGTGFHLRSPQDRELDPEEADAASELLGRLFEFSKADVVSKGGGDFTPVARAKARRGEHEEVVEVGPMVADARVILRRQTDGARLEVKPEIARRLLPRKTTLKPRTLLGETRRVTKMQLRCGTAQDFVDDGKGLRLVDPKGYETDGGIVSLVDTLLRSKIDAWVWDSPDPSFGIEKGACKVTLEFEDGKNPKTILLGADGETGLFGRIDGQPEVFVAPKSLKDLASAIYVSRDLGGLYAERVMKLGKPVITPVEITQGKITCGPIGSNGNRSCARQGIDATFEVSSARLEKLASDAGPR